VDAGRTAILHEEVLRGVHMLSVAHLPPGSEVEVRSAWVITLTNIGGRSFLHIPLTAGDIYGRSPLADSDGLIHAPVGGTASLTVGCADGTVNLRGADLQGGRATVPLNAPIELEVIGWFSRELYGRAADGRRAVLHVEPVQSEEASVDAAIIVDRSGSMAEPVSAGESHNSKHRAVLRALRALARQAKATDVFDVWQFDDEPEHIGTSQDPDDHDGDDDHQDWSPGDGLLRLVNRLNRPRGGTEIGRALTEVMAESNARDLMLITDGKSYELDVHELARAGRRICAILVGEDSLEANVGHLAALTGGEIFVAGGHDLTAVLKQGLRSLRAPYAAPKPIEGLAQAVMVRRGGMLIRACWNGEPPAAQDSIETRAVAALAAALHLPARSAEAAAQLAEAEGLVTHLTSLVLIDEAGEVQNTLPAARKVPLPTPHTGVMYALAAQPEEQFARACGLPGRKLGRYRWSLGYPHPTGATLDLSRTGIDWDLAPHRLEIGDLSLLGSDDAEAIRQAATHAEVAKLAAALHLDPIMLVIGLLAYGAAKTSRTASRIARSIFKGEPREEALTVGRMLGLF
jgi:hypothetical protein